MSDDTKILSTCGPIRISSGKPIAIRWARRYLADGAWTDELQAAYEWWTDHERGIEWRAVETVVVTGAGT